MCRESNLGVYQTVTQAAKCSDNWLTQIEISTLNYNNLVHMFNTLH